MKKSGVLSKLVETIKMHLEELGIVVVDETCYTFERYYRNGRVVVITGYIPEKAALFTATVRTWTRMDFSISGLLRVKNEIINIEDSEFVDILVNDEWLKDHHLYINYCTDRISQEKQIEKGISFFKRFIMKYENEFETRFSKKINLNIIPIENDQFAEMRRERGMDTTLKHFEEVITKKLPKGFYPN